MCVICDVAVVVVCFLKIFFVVKQKEAHTRTPHPPPSWVGLSVKQVLPVSLTIELEVAHRGGHGGVAALDCIGCWL